jgi:hypothetical protein
MEAELNHSTMNTDKFWKRKKALIRATFQFYTIVLELQIETKVYWMTKTTSGEYNLQSVA